MVALAVEPGPLRQLKCHTPKSLISLENFGLQTQLCEDGNEQSRREKITQAQPHAGSRGEPFVQRPCPARTW